MNNNERMFQLIDELNQAKESAKSLINNCNVELANAFELLEFKRYKTILSNIIYLGLPNELKRVDNKGDK